MTSIVKKLNHLDKRAERLSVMESQGMAIAADTLSLGQYLGKHFEKSVAHNSATNLVSITLTGNLAASFLVSIAAKGARTDAACSYILNLGYSAVNINAIGTLAQYGTVALTPAVAVNTGTGVITLSITQTNGSTEAMYIETCITPLATGDGADVTFAAL